MLSSALAGAKDVAKPVEKKSTLTPRSDLSAFPCLKQDTASVPEYAEAVYEPLILGSLSANTPLSYKGEPVVSVDLRSVRRFHCGLGEPRSSW
jgi:hypothetical protein